MQLRSCEILYCVTGKFVPNTLGQYDSEDLTVILSGDIWHQIPNNQDQSQKCGHPRQVNNLVALKLIFFKCYWPRTWLVNIFDGMCPNCGSFLEKLFHMRKPEKPYFQLCQWLLSTLGSYPAGLPLVWPCQWQTPLEGMKSNSRKLDTICIAGIVSESKA